MLYDQMTGLEQSICKVIARETKVAYPDVRFVFCQTESVDKTLTVLRFCMMSGVDAIQGLKEVPWK